MGSRGPYHRLDIGMWDSVKFMILEFQIRSDVDICAFVLRTVAVFWCREDCTCC
jgi:hypothetical protein